MISVLAEPDVLKLLVRKMVGRRDVLHLRPVHDGARPPESWDVVRGFDADPAPFLDGEEPEVDVRESLRTPTALSPSPPRAPAPPGATITPPAAEVKRRANTKGADSRPRAQDR